jgi:hypothetical protein
LYRQAGHLPPVFSSNYALFGLAVRFRFEAKLRGTKAILFASKRNRGVCFACFALKQNSGFHMQNEKEVKLNEAKKRSETKQKKRSEISEKQYILKQKLRENSHYYARKEK